MSRHTKFLTVIRGASLEERMEKLKIYEDYADWAVGQQETGDTGFDHIQLMFGFENARSLKTLLKRLPDAGNIEVVKNAKAAYKYCIDEEKRTGEVYSYGDIPDMNGKQSDTNSLITRAKETGDVNSALKLIEEENISYYISQAGKLRIYFSQLFDAPDVSKYEITSFRRAPLNFDQSKCWILCGETNLGKTQFALAHFTAPLLVRTKQDYARYKPGITDGLILDDIGFRTWKPETLLHTVETETATTFDIKYGSVRIPADLPRIICINTMEAFWPDGIFAEHKAAIERRIQILYVHNKLY